MPAGEKPLYLHIEATTQEMLEKAVAKVEDLIKNDAVPDLHVIDRRGREREMEREAREKDDRDRRDRRGGVSKKKGSSDGERTFLLALKTITDPFAPFPYVSNFYFHLTSSGDFDSIGSSESNRKCQ